MQFPPEPEGRRCQTDMPKEDVARGVGDQTNTTAVRERSVSQHSARSRSEDRAMDALRRLGRRERETNVGCLIPVRLCPSVCEDRRCVLSCNKEVQGW